MSTRQPLDLLEKVHVYVLEQAALGWTNVALSAVTFSVDRPAVLGLVHVTPQRPQRGHVRRLSRGVKRSSKLGHRGHVQRCLSELAKSGVMWERRRPEGGMMYEPADKHFHIRITKDEAIAKLRELGKKVPVRETGWSAHWSPSLGAHPDIKYVD